MKIMISACLAGENCKYNGGNNRNERLVEALSGHEVLPVCPEVLGGLPTPRIPSEIRDGIAVNREGISVDREFREGANKCLEIARKARPDLVILQSRSPSCGVNNRYDGTFSGKLTEGSGIAAQLLKENGFCVVDLEDFSSWLPEGASSEEKDKGVPAQTQAPASGDTQAGEGDEEGLAWQEISTEHIVRDEWIDIRSSVYRYPDGRVFSPFYTYSRRDYVVVVASDEKGRYICVRQFRQGIREVTTEFVAGGIEDGWNSAGGGKDRKKEDALAAAKRELKEETGYESDEWKHLLTVPANATIADNFVHLFTAENCRLTGVQHLDETEVIRPKLLSAGDIDELIAQGKFQQAIHILAWELAKKNQ